ncbi:MAG TPA: hypothetical protein VEX18_04655, partial [Polyangiaceae bacterium]|nr:hypothetical protein [Polyangiaceae bacterium]
MAFSTLGRGFLFVALTGVLLACGSNPELVIPPVIQGTDEAGAPNGGRGDDPISLGGAVEHGEGGN